MSDHMLAQFSIIPERLLAKNALKRFIFFGGVRAVDTQHVSFQYMFFMEGFPTLVALKRPDVRMCFDVTVELLPELECL